MRAVLYSHDRKMKMRQWYLNMLRHYEDEEAIRVIHDLRVNYISNRTTLQRRWYKSFKEEEEMTMFLFKWT